MSATSPAALEIQRHDERKQVLADGWLLMLLAVALAIGIPWFLRNSPVDAGPLTWGVFAYGAAYLLLSHLVDGLANARARLEALTAMQGATVLFLAYLWYYVGALQNPMFLMALVLPVAAAACVLSAARALGLALAAIASVTFVALSTAPQLRWYFTQLGVPVDAMPSIFLRGGPQPFPGMEITAAYAFLTLVTFAVLLLATALLGQSFAAQLRAVLDRLGASSHALRQASALAGELVKALPAPAVLVYADTFNVAYASDAFLERMGVVAERLHDTDLLGLVELGAPDTLRQVVAQGGGDIAVASYRVDGRLHLARLRVKRLEHARTVYALVTFEEAFDTIVSGAALDAAADALVVIGWDGRIVAFNATAGRTLEPLHAGDDAATVLGRADDAADWWVLGPRGARERRLSLGGRPFDARCTAVALPGLQERLTVVRLAAVPA